MPPRFAYWTILVGGLPTAFRAAQREEIEPTFRRLREKHPDAEMRWFARGRLWASPEEAREATERLKAKGQRPKFVDRDRSWRPGGSHRDPRQPYIDAKKRENQKRRERRFEFKKDSGPQAPGSRPPEDRPKWKPQPDRKWGRPPQKSRPQTADRRPETGERRPESKRPAPKAWERPLPKWGQGQGQRPKAQGQRPNEEPKRWERPLPKWGERQGQRPKAQSQRPNDEQKREKPAWKDRSRPGAWSPKPGARNRPPRKGPRGPR
jgi:hypothetical protein